MSMRSYERKPLPQLWRLLNQRDESGHPNWNSVLDRMLNYPEEIMYDDDLYNRELLYCFLKPEFQPPDEVLLTVIKLHPKALTIDDWMGRLPLHRAIRQW